MYCEHIGYSVPKLWFLKLNGNNSNDPKFDIMFKIMKYMDEVDLLGWIFNSINGNGWPSKQVLDYVSIALFGKIQIGGVDMSTCIRYLNI